MGIFKFTYSDFMLFILVFIRVSSILVLVPIFGSKSVPYQVKVSLSIIMALIIFPLLNLKAVDITTVPEFVLGIASEVMIGIAVGYSSKMIFTGIQLAGHIIGFQIGYAVVNVFDPTTSSQVSVIAEMKYLLSVLIFLSLGVHHMILRAIVESFALIPLMEAKVSAPLIQILIKMFGNIFIIGMKMAAPIIATMMFINVSLGLIAKTVPQMNVFIVGFPLQIAIGLAMLVVSMPVFYLLVTGIFKDFTTDVMLVLRAL